MQEQEIPITSHQAIPLQVEDQNNFSQLNNNQ